MAAEMKTLRLQLKQTMEMYNSACKETISAQNKVMLVMLSLKENAEKIMLARLDKQLN